MNDKARVPFDKLKLSEKLVDVTKVKLNQLAKLGSLYKDDSKVVTEAFERVEMDYPDRKNNLFFKSVVSVVIGEEKPQAKSDDP